MVLNQVMQRVLVAVGGILMYIAISATPIGPFIDKWAIPIMIGSVLLILFSKKLAAKTKLNDDIPIVVGGTTLFLSGKKFLIPYITGNIAWVAMGIAVVIIIYKKELAELVLR